MEKKFIFDAFDLAQEYFKDKKDLSGRPYMGHMERIAAAIEKERDKNCADKESSLFLYYDKAIAVAFLHDIIEDTDCTEEILYEKGFDKEIVTAVIAITRRKDEQYYFDFIDRVFVSLSIQNLLNHISETSKTDTARRAFSTGFNMAHAKCIKS